MWVHLDVPTTVRENIVQERTNMRTLFGVKFHSKAHRTLILGSEPYLTLLLLELNLGTFVRRQIHVPYQLSYSLEMPLTIF